MKDGCGIPRTWGCGMTFRCQGCQGRQRCRGGCRRCQRVPKVPKVRTARRGASSDLDALVDQLNEFEKARKGGRLRLPDGDWLEVTNLHKIFWPALKKTKGDLLRHYARVAPLILPVVNDRPLVMKRLPNGVEGEAFYQHRAPEPVPSGVRIETLPEDDVPARLVGGSLKTLLYMAQLASISMDPWFSRMEALDTPDQVAIDLDPQPGATFAQILDVARWVHDELERLHVPSFPKTSGSEGLHIFIPLPPGTPYEAGMLFCQIVATMVAAKHPEGGHRRAHGEQAQGQDDLRRLPAEHPGQDPGVRLQRARERVRRRLHAAHVEGSGRRTRAAGLHPRHDRRAPEGRRATYGPRCEKKRAPICSAPSKSSFARSAALRDLVTEIAILPDGEPFLGGVLPVMTAEAPRELHVAAVVGMVAPAQLHRREHVAAVQVPKRVGAPHDVGLA